MAATAAVGLSMGMLQVFLGSCWAGESSPGGRAELQDVGPGIGVEGSSAQAWGGKEAIGAFLFNFPTAKLGFGAGRSVPLPTAVGYPPPCWANLETGGGLRGAAAPSYLRGPTVLALLRPCLCKPLV